MLAQTETKNKVPFGNHKGRPDKSDGLDPQSAKIKKELTLAQREIVNLKFQLHQAKENMAKGRAEHSSKSKRTILRTMTLEIREPVNKLSVPRQS